MSIMSEHSRAPFHIYQPVLILYVDGKEVLREARFVHVEL